MLFAFEPAADDQLFKTVSLGSQGSTERPLSQPMKKKGSFLNVVTRHLPHRKPP